VNTPKLAQALTNIADALYEASEALTEQPASLRSAGVAGTAVTPPPAVPGLPEIPPLEEWSGEVPAEMEAPTVQLQGSEALCPKHKTPFVPSKFAGKPPYCTQKSTEPNWSRNGYCSITAKSAIAWIKQHAAIPA